MRTLLRLAVYSGCIIAGMVLGTYAEQIANRLVPDRGLPPELRYDPCDEGCIVKPGHDGPCVIADEAGIDAAPYDLMKKVQLTDVEKPLDFEATEDGAGVE